MIYTNGPIVGIKFWPELTKFPDIPSIAGIFIAVSADSGFLINFGSSESTFLLPDGQNTKP
jgi:hypothetical protein